MNKDKKLNKQNEILKEILKRALENLGAIFDFENTTEQEFKEIYGYTKKQIKEVLK